MQLTEILSPGKAVDETNKHRTKRHKERKIGKITDEHGERPTDREIRTRRHLPERLRTRKKPALNNLVKYETVLPSVLLDPVKEEPSGEPAGKRKIKKIVSKAVNLPVTEDGKWKEGKLKKREEKGKIFFDPVKPDKAPPESEETPLISHVRRGNMEFQIAELVPVHPDVRDAAIEASTMVWREQVGDDPASMKLIFTREIEGEDGFADQNPDTNITTFAVDKICGNRSQSAALFEMAHAGAGAASYRVYDYHHQGEGSQKGSTEEAEGDDLVKNINETAGRTAQHMYPRMIDGEEWSLEEKVDVLPPLQEGQPVIEKRGKVTFRISDFVGVPPELKNILLQACTIMWSDNVGEPTTMNINFIDFFVDRNTNRRMSITGYHYGEGNTTTIALEPLKKYDLGSLPSTASPKKKMAFAGVHESTHKWQTYQGRAAKGNIKRSHTDYDDDASEKEANTEAERVLAFMERAGLLS